MPGSAAWVDTAVNTSANVETLRAVFNFMFLLAPLTFLKPAYDRIDEVGSLGSSCKSKIKAVLKKTEQGLNVG